MSKGVKFLFAMAFFFLGAFVGFMIAPIKSGIGINNYNHSHNSHNIVGTEDEE